MPTWMNIYTQDSNSPLMEQLIFFHDQVMMISNANVNGYVNFMGMVLMCLGWNVCSQIIWHFVFR